MFSTLYDLVKYLIILVRSFELLCLPKKYIFKYIYIYIYTYIYINCGGGVLVVHGSCCGDGRGKTSN